MKKFILCAVLLLVGLGLGFYIPHGAKQSNEDQVGAYRRTPDYFNGGLYAGESNQFSVDSAGNASTTASATVSGSVYAQTYRTTSIGVATTSSTNLGAAAAGFIAIPTGATSFFATSTVMDINSQIFLTQLSTTTNAALLAALGTAQCNLGVASTTPTVGVFASTTSATNNYFKLTLQAAPGIQPHCYSYRISN